MKFKLTVWAAMVCCWTDSELQAVTARDNHTQNPLSTTFPPKTPHNLQAASSLVFHTPLAWVFPCSFCTQNTFIIKANNGSFESEWRLM